MLVLNNLSGFNAKTQRKMEYLGYAFDNANVASYTFPNFYLGEPTSTRRIALFLPSRRGAAVKPTAITVNGFPLSSIIDYSPNTVDRTMLWVGNVPTGSIGDIVVTESASASREQLFAYRLDRLNSYTTLTDSVSGTGVTTSALTVNNGGVGVFCGLNQLNNGTALSGFTLDRTANGNGSEVGGLCGSEKDGSGATPTITATFTSEASPHYIGAAWA